ncbi:MAG: hypothetical protein LUE97_08540 [Oscillospiraceae bacterium]|nr:hypothetical protein [Oscillospiraceae bacterium]
MKNLTVRTRATILIVILSLSLVWTTYNWRKEKERNDAVFDMVTREWYGTNLEGIYGLLWTLDNYIGLYLEAENEPYHRAALSGMVGGAAVALSRSINGMNRYCEPYYRHVTHFDDDSSTLSRAIELISKNYPLNADEQFMTDFYTGIKPYIEQLLEYAEEYSYENAETPYEAAELFDIFLRKSKLTYYNLHDLIVEWPYPDEITATIA